LNARSHRIARDAGGSGWRRHAAGLILRKAACDLPSKNALQPPTPRGRAVNTPLIKTLQLLAFSIATLLATGVLVLAGLNERAHAPESLASITHSTKDPR